MSLFENYKSIQPAIDYRRENFHLVDQKNTDGMMIYVLPASSYSNSSCNFSYLNNFQNIAVDRCIKLEIPVLLTFTGTTTGSGLLQAGYDAFASMPLNEIMQTCSMTIGQQNLTVNTNLLRQYASRCEKLKDVNSQQIFANDYYANLYDGVGSINNPLGIYSNTVDGVFHPRGAYPCVINNGATTATVSATLTTPLWIPMLTNENVGNGLAFRNFTNFQCVITWTNNLSRIWSHANSSATITNIDVQLGQPSLRITQYTVSTLLSEPCIYPYDYLQYFISSNTGSIAANATTTVNSNAIQLSYLPHEIDIYIRKPDSQITYTSSRSFLSINSVSINFSGRSGILASANSNDLFRMSKKNGLQDTYEQWRGFTQNLGSIVPTSGSFLKLRFGEDIALAADEFVGKDSSFNLQVSVNVTNNTGSTWTTNELWIVTHTPARVIMGEQVEVKIGVDRNNTGEHFVDYYGGSLSNILKKSHDFIKRHKLISRAGDVLTGIAKSALPQAAPIVGALTGFAKHHGYGNGEMEDEYDGGFVAGKSLSKAQLRKRLSQLS